MRNIALGVWLTILGLQLEIGLTRHWQGHPLIGSNEDLIIFFGGAFVEALLLLIWFVAANNDVDWKIRDQEHQESSAEVAQSSSLSDIRGGGIEDLVNSSDNRMRLMFDAFRRHAGRFLLLSTYLLLLVWLLELFK